MNPLDALWHLLGFAAVPVLLGFVATAAVKLLWRGALSGVPAVRLAVRAAFACLGVALAGLALTGRDGAMATYAAMVGACALVLWWPLRR